MRNKIIKQKFDPDWVTHDNDNPGCDCGAGFEEADPVFLYPNYDDEESWQVLCMTCHFWFTHDVLEELGR